MFSKGEFCLKGVRLKCRSEGGRLQMRCSARYLKPDTADITMWTHLWIYTYTAPLSLVTSWIPLTIHLFVLWRTLCVLYCVPEHGKCYGMSRRMQASCARGTVPFTAVTTSFSHEVPVQTGPPNTREVGLFHLSPRNPPPSDPDEKLVCRFVLSIMTAATTTFIDLIASYLVLCDASPNSFNSYVLHMNTPCSVTLFCYLIITMIQKKSCTN